MDIDIATYRVRIGTFNPRALNLKTKVTKPKRNSEKKCSILSPKDKMTKNESKKDSIHKFSKDFVCIFQSSGLLD